MILNVFALIQRIYTSFRGSTQTTYMIMKICCLFDTMEWSGVFHYSVSFHSISSYQRQTDPKNIKGAKYRES